MILVAFRSRLRPEHEAEYRAMAQELAPQAMAIPGYIAHKTFTAEDGERLTLVEYESQEAVQAWGRHEAHAVAKREGRQRFFSEFRVQICNVLRDHGSKPPPGATPYY
jgi:heme-degrading monooxygenase HmoA